MRKLLHLALALMAVGLLSSPFAAQEAAPVSAGFDAATIKQSKDPDGVGIGFIGDRFIAKGASLKDLINAAYGLRTGSNDEIAEGPSWAESLKFDVEAKTDKEKSSRFMLQALLEDRFKLKVHTEGRVLPVYALVVATGGSRLAASSPEPSASTDAPMTSFGAVVPAPSPDRWHGGRIIGRGQLKGSYETMSMLIRFLQLQPELAGRSVLDRTGLNGQYDFLLRWDPQAEPGEPRDSGLPAADESRPSLLTALQEQLGLKLEATKGQVTVIVIDSAEKPAGN